MEEYTATKEQVKAELIRRFQKSKARSGAIVLTMKKDLVKLIIVPELFQSADRSVEKARAFSVYTDRPEGRIALDDLCATSFEELVYNIMYYSGIDFDRLREKGMHIMNDAPDFVAEYDMYDPEELPPYCRGGAGH